MFKGYTEGMGSGGGRLPVGVPGGPPFVGGGPVVADPVDPGMSTETGESSALTPLAEPGSPVAMDSSEGEARRCVEVEVSRWAVDRDGVTGLEWGRWLLPNREGGGDGSLVGVNGCCEVNG